MKYKNVIVRQVTITGWEENLKESSELLKAQHWIKKNGYKEVEYKIRFKPNSPEAKQIGFRIVAEKQIEG